MKISLFFFSFVLVLWLQTSPTSAQPCPNMITINGVQFQAPDIAGCPGGNVGRGFVNISNACNNRVGTIFPPIVQSGPVGCNGARGQRLRWEVKVNGGPSNFVCQVVGADDNEKPVLTLPPRFNRTQAECGGPLPEVIPNIEVTDNCQPPPRARLLDTQRNINNRCRDTANVENRAGRVVRTFGATDACGNDADPITQVTILIDTTPPRLNSPLPTVRIPCTDIDHLPDTDRPDVTDQCYPNNLLAFSKKDTLDPNGCRAIRSWNISDPCGNSRIANQTIRLIDNTHPEVDVKEDSFCLWPPNGRFFCVNLRPPNNPDLSQLVTFTDACPGVKSVRVIDCSVQQCRNPPCSAKRGSDSRCFFNENRFCLEVKNGGENRAREYELSMEVDDFCGNTSSFTLTFVVPVSDPGGCFRGTNNSP